MSQYTQKNRAIKLEGVDVSDFLLPESIEATESLSSPFTYKITAFSENELDGSELIGKPLDLSIKTNAHWIDYHGFTESFEIVGCAQNGLFKYQIVVVPRIKFLMKSSRCRIFQNKTTLEIVSEIFKDCGLNFLTLKI